MQFATTVAALFAATAAAVPSSTRGGAVSAQAMQQLQTQSGCSILGCVVGLGSAAVDCAFAIAMEGIDIDKDITCIKAVIGDVASPPAACLSCLEAI